MIIKVKKLYQNVIMPKYAHPGDAGMDLFSIEEKKLASHSGHIFKTGLSIEIPDGYFGLIKERSSFGKLGVIVAGGIIDSGYRGEILISLFNCGRQSINIKKSERIAQLIIIPVLNAKIAETSKLSETSRGQGGFGSTGRK